VRGAEVSRGRRTGEGERGEVEREFASGYPEFFGSASFQADVECKGFEQSTTDMAPEDEVEHGKEGHCCDVA
jgi:hypothetical protein